MPPVTGLHVHALAVGGAVGRITGWSGLQRRPAVAARREAFRGKDERLLECCCRLGNMLAEAVSAVSPGCSVSKSSIKERRCM